MHLFSRYTLLSLGVLLEAAHLFQFGILYAALVVAALTFGPLTKRGEAFASSSPRSMRRWTKRINISCPSVRRR